MIANTNNTRWSRQGRHASRIWRGYLRREQRIADWFMARGVPPSATRGLLWIVKLAVLVTLLYVAFWFGLLLLFAVAAVGAAGRVGRGEKPEDEWRNGTAGFGLYTYDDYRVDPHVSDEG